MVRSYHDQANEALKNQIEYDFPKLFKVDLWDNWLVDDKYPMWLGYFKKENSKALGVNHRGNWDEHQTLRNPNHDNHNKIATEEQIFEGLTKEAKRRGYKEGNHKCLVVQNEYKTSITGSQYFPNSNRLYLNGRCVFNDGVWAEIIEKPVYEWQWLMRNNNTYWLTHGYHEDVRHICRNTNNRIVKRIKETKRLRK